MNTRKQVGVEDAIPRELADLGKRLEALSGPGRSELIWAHQRVVDVIRRRCQILSIVKEGLSQLRLDLKYLIFDLEVTRQERDELQKRLDA